MAHHSSGPDPELVALFKKEFGSDTKLGATGQFPRGKLTKRDEGEIQIAIGSHNGAVVIDFGEPTTWIGFTPDQAFEIADLLRAHARAVRAVPDRAQPSNAIGVTTPAGRGDTQKASAE